MSEIPLTSEAPGYQHGDLVTVAATDTPLKFVEKTGPWVELTPPDSYQVGFTVHHTQIQEQP